MTIGYQLANGDALCLDCPCEIEHDLDGADLIDSRDAHLRDQVCVECGQALVDFDDMPADTVEEMAF
jgi:hypothetical protein